VRDPKLQSFCIWFQKNREIAETRMRLFSGHAPGSYSFANFGYWVIYDFLGGKKMPYSLFSDNDMYDIGKRVAQKLGYGYLFR